MRMEPERKRLIGERLRQACIIKNDGREHGIASRLAEDMDISVQTASKWLRGTVTPGMERWPELAAKLNVTVAWLTGTSHDEPEGIKGKLDQRSIDLAGQAARLVFPLVIRLKPTVSQEEVDELVRMAYQQLLAGRPEDAVSGEIATRLL